ncbi:MAG TPA: ABC transporter family substrate-binding protein, partial [Pseudonocardiaceae bacterium]|nr:ABC transporter family substrate-binding protein [Pseudonocardiaceae bacterium]
LIATGADGGPSASLVAGDLLTAPTQAGYRATMPAHAPGASPDPAHVPALLAQAGYVQDGAGWTRSGHMLNVVIAAPAGEQPYVAVASQLRAQLIGAGIPASVVTPTASQLFEQELAANPPTTSPAGSPAEPIDIVVGPQPTGGDPATELASWFGCTGTTGASTHVSSGPLAWCVPSLQSDIESALTGETPLASVLAKVEPQLWAQAVEIPLFQVSDALAVGSGVDGVEAGPPFVGPFFSAAGWSRVTSG